MAQGSLEEGTLRSSVGSARSAASTLTTPQVEVDSAMDRSSGMKASLSPRSAPLDLFSDREFRRSSRYWGELYNVISAYKTSLESMAYLSARAIIEVGSSVRTIMDESLKICSGSFIGSSYSDDRDEGC